MKYNYDFSHTAASSWHLLNILEKKVLIYVNTIVYGTFKNLRTENVLYAPCAE